MGRRTGLGLAAALALAGSVAAQSPDLADQQRRLAIAKRDAAAAASRADSLTRSAQAQKNAAARAAAQQQALAARVAAGEAQLEAARARVAVVNDLLRAQRARLSEAQAPAARLLAALQSLARRPAVAAVAQPGSVDDLVHLRAVLGGALPVIEARATAVRQEVYRTERLQADAALAARALRDARGKLEVERVALAKLEASYRTRAQALGRDAISESDRALALGERARDIVDRLAAEGQAQVAGETLATLPGPLPRPVRASAAPGQTASVAYRLPIAGRLTTGFDAVSPSGVRSRGLSFVVRPGAVAVAPAAGRVRFARPYRGYGVVVVIDHGEGWSTTLTGLGSAQVSLGTAVAAGTRVGQAATGEQPEVTVELRRRGRPVDITALL